MAYFYSGYQIIFWETLRISKIKWAKWTWLQVVYSHKGKVKRYRLYSVTEKTVLRNNFLIKNGQDGGNLNKLTPISYTVLVSESTLQDQPMFWSNRYFKTLVLFTWSCLTSSPKPHIASCTDCFNRYPNAEMLKYLMHKESYFHIIYLYMYLYILYIISILSVILNKIQVVLIFRK